MKHRRLIVRPFAKLDIAEAALWYQQQRIGLGDELLQAVGEQIKAIVENPRAFPVVRDQGIRRALVNRFPYAVYFIKTENGFPSSQYFTPVRTQSDT